MLIKLYNISKIDNNYRIIYNYYLIIYPYNKISNIMLIRNKTNKIKLKNSTDINIRTFVDLYNFLISYNKDNILEWLKDSWVGKDKQESLLRLFSGLGLIEKLKDFDICLGNFNLGNIKKIENYSEIFYDTKITF